MSNEVHDHREEWERGPIVECGRFEGVRVIKSTDVRPSLETVGEISYEDFQKQYPDYSLKDTSAVLQKEHDRHTRTVHLGDKDYEIPVDDPHEFLELSDDID